MRGEEEASLEECKSLQSMPQQQNDDDNMLIKRRASRLRRWLPRLQWAWAIHFGITFLLILYGIYYNGGKQ